MRFVITGEHGFIGRNLARVIQELGHEFVSLTVADNNSNYSSKTMNSINGLHKNPGEPYVPCVWKNGPYVWEQLFREMNIDVVIHNAAMVGTDVVGLNPRQATLSNVMGTHNVVEGAKRAMCAVSFMGTSVIYDTAQFQNRTIYEHNQKRPTTYYGQLKLVGEDIVKGSGVLWNIIRPLFAYGGDGDMNSLIAKIFFAHLTDTKRVAMFLDPTKFKDYIFVDDYCRAVVRAAIEGLWGEDFNIAAETPLTVGHIVNTMSSLVDSDLNDIVDWYPETDYLGNHKMSSEKFRQALRRQPVWEPELTLNDGLARVLEDIRKQVEDPEGSSYNPLHHLEKAQDEGVYLPEFFPS